MVGWNSGMRLSPVRRTRLGYCRASVGGNLFNIAHPAQLRAKITALLPHEPGLTNTRFNPLFRRTSVSISASQ